MINEEIAKFTSIASNWWEKNGPFKMLHEITPIRLEYIFSRIKENFNVKSNNQLDGLRILDAGCGGGILSIPLANAGAKVLGVDLGKENIDAATLEAKKQNINVKFEYIDIEEIVDQRFDVVICSEVLEHVDNPEKFILNLSKLMDENSILILSTINRTLKSKLLAIYFAEYLINALPKGTHEYEKFITPSEMNKFCTNAKLKAINSQGMNFNLLSKKWSLTSDLEINYFITFKK